MTWEQSPQPVTIRTQRRIGGLQGFMTINESGTDELEVTQHPVQRGAAVTDHAYVKPATLNVQLMFDDREMSLEDRYKQLLNLQALREPLDVVTGKRIYRSMLIKSLAITTDVRSEFVLSVACLLQEVRLVDVVVTTVPPRAKQRTPGKTGATEKAGAKQAKNVTDSQPKKRSGLAILIGGK